MAAFQPKGAKAQWAMLYDKIRTLPIGGRLTYAEMQQITGGSSLSTARTALARAVDELQREDSRTMANVRGVGYEVVEAREHAVLAKGRLQRSKVQVRKGIRIVKGTNLSRLTPEELKLLDGISDRLEAHLDVDRRRARADQRYVVNTATRKMRVEMDQRLEEQRLEFERRMAEQLQRLGFMPSEESQTG